MFALQPGLATAQTASREQQDAVLREGIDHSQAYGFVEDLTTRVGARLMGSPNMTKAYDWASAQLQGLGLNARRESMGEFGLSWRQDKIWLRMTAPDVVAFDVQSAPWSASAKPTEAQAAMVTIKTVADFETYRGKIAGKAVLLGPAGKAELSASPPTVRFSDADIDSGAAMAFTRYYYAHRPERLRARAASEAFTRSLLRFLAEEKIAVLILPNAGGSVKGGNALNGALTVDNRYAPQMYRPENRPPYPIVVAASEQFRRAWRLAETGQTVRLNFEIDTKTFNEHETGYNIVAEFPGVDPKLKSETVLIGAHLDSWGAGVGAVDNGTGVATCLEVIRLLKASGFKPARTIRVVLYGGEEQGRLGAFSDLATHLKTAEGKRLPEADRFVVAYNIDSGSGRIRAVITGSNPAVAQAHRRWIQPLAGLGVRTVFDEPYLPADQSVYTEAGFPAVTFVQDPLDYDTTAHHTSADTLEHVSPEDLAQASTVMALLVMQAASEKDLQATFAKGQPQPAPR